VEKIKSYFKYVNQWSLLFWGFVVLQIVLGIVRDHLFWDTFWACALIWGLYMLGQNAYDRELEIRLDRIKEQIATQN
jgi:hypothetical protein